MNLHIIYTETKMLLSKKSYCSWQEIQDEFSDFKASLGPWSDEEIESYLQSEYSRLQPTAAEQVAAFMQSASVQSELTFSA